MVIRNHAAGFELVEANANCPNCKSSRWRLHIYPCEQITPPNEDGDYERVYETDCIHCGLDYKLTFKIRITYDTKEVRESNG